MARYSSYGTQNSNASVHLLDGKTKKAKDSRRHVRKVLVPDEYILDMRYQSEVNRLSYTQIYALYPQYGKPYIRTVLGYTIRAHLRIEVPETV